MNLTDLKQGEYAKVAELLNSDGIKRRLRDLGLIEGTDVHCIHKSPFGDPVAYGIRGAVIALRHEDARGVKIRSSDKTERYKS